LYVHLSLPGYGAKALNRFQHPPPNKPEYSPHASTDPTYGTTSQCSSPEDTSPKLDAPERLKLQEIIGTLLYYVRAIGCTMLVA
jgi:hypothetical protein